jgi:hypothetical protein
MYRDGLYGRAMLILLLLSLAVRAFLAAFLEFGNDEVYYRTYALFPALSHFDHPPMIGLLIQLTTFNLAFDTEFFIRLGAVMLGTLNIWLIYLIGKKVCDTACGFYAALLYTSSVYAFLIAGTFILPDTPQLTFWLLTLYLLLHALTDQAGRRAGRYLFLAGFAAGLALLSKYTSVFLLTGALMYVIIYNRSWLKRGELYLAGLIAVMLFLPVIAWNTGNDFISFTFHGDRVGFFNAGLRPDFFLTEVGGQALYNNPVNFVLGIIAMIAFFRGKSFIGKENGRLILLIALPPILLFLFFSLFRHTLPHWTGPAWTTLIVFSAAYIRRREMKKGRERLFPPAIVASLAVVALVISLGLLQVRYGVLYNDPGTRPENLGKNDVSLDMYGWKQLADGFRQTVEKEKEGKGIHPFSPVISHRWFPAANIDYYLAGPLGIRVLGLGSLDGLHKYAWITQKRGGFELGMDAWYITVSRDFRDPVSMYGPYFNSVEPADTIPVYRNGRHVLNGFVYYLKGMKQLPEKIIPSEKTP